MKRARLTNPVVWLLLIAALLRGMFDFVRTDFAANQSLWGGHWYDSALCYAGLLFVALAFTARKRPLAAAISAIGLQVALIAYFFVRVGYFSIVWVPFECMPLALSFVAFGAALDFNHQRSNHLFTWTLIAVALLRGVIDFGGSLEGSLEMWNPHAPIYSGLIFLMLAFASRRRPCISIGGALFIQMGIMVYAVMKGTGFSILYESFLFILLAVGEGICLHRKMRQTIPPAGPSEEDNTPESSKPELRDCQPILPDSQRLD